ncbi:MAG: glycosyltransferase family 61 protein [Betaproteobacteria bacterium]|nr:glycosyltransferase family 61 protein [Betaproteobacteria bacterium]
MKRHVFTSDLSNKAFRNLLGERSLQEIATKVEEISPPSEVTRTNACFDPGDISKVTDVGMGTTLEFELQRIQAGVSPHKGTYAYELHDVTLMDGALYKFRFKHGISYRKQLTSHTGQVEVVEDGGTLAQSWLGSRYFGHWVRDDIPLAWLAKQIGNPTGIHRPLTPQQLAYAEILGVEFSTLPHVAHLSKITVLTDSHYNQGKVARWKTMRDAIASRAIGKKFNGVMLLRGFSGESRVLLNELEIAERLERLGFYIVNPGTMDVEKFLSEAAAADIVVGVEGSQLANGFFCMKEDASMLVLQPPFRFNNIYKDACDAIGARYGFVVGDLAANGFTVDAEAVERIVERLCQT